MARPDPNTLTTYKPRIKDIKPNISVDRFEQPEYIGKRDLRAHSCHEWVEVLDHNLTRNSFKLRLNLFKQCSLLINTNRRLGLTRHGPLASYVQQRKWFEAGSLTKNPDPTQRLTLAGGKESLSVHLTGMVELFDVKEDKIELHTALYVPSLKKNLIAGGAIVKKGVQTIVDQSNKDIFAMIIGDQNLFKGFFNGNLMILKLEPFKVSPTIKNLNSTSQLIPFSPSTNG